MNKEIQEKRIEKELSILESSTLRIKIKKITKGQYKINVTIEASEMNPILEGDIEFEIHFGPLFPYKSPSVFCKTAFSTPHIADGRDLIDDIIGQSWIPSFKIIDIISKIPEFINNYVKHLQEGYLILIGNYYLGEKYDLNFLQTLPVFIRKVKERVFLDHKERTIERILLVSDIYMCLFDVEKWSQNTVYLMFWTNFRSLITIKKNAKENVVRFFFKQHFKKTLHELVIEFEDAQMLVGNIMSTMKSLGIKYKVSKSNALRTGVIPQVDVELVEILLNKLEPEMKKNPNNSQVQEVMNLYQKLIEYYSATNNEKYEVYIKKLHDFLNFPVIKIFLEEEDKRRNSSLDRSDGKHENSEGKHENKLGRQIEIDSYFSEEKIKINHKDKIEVKKEI